MNFEQFKTKTCIFCEENLVRNLRYFECGDKLADHQLSIDVLNKQVFITCYYNKYVIILDFLENKTIFVRQKEKLIRDYIIDFSSIEEIEKFAENNFNKLDIFKF